MNSRLIFLLSLPFLLFSTDVKSGSNLYVRVNNSLSELPDSIFAPVVVRKAPTNEASIVAIDGQYKIFYINRPGPADQMMSEASKDGISWGSPTSEFTLPGTAYYANQLLQDTKGTIHSVFHIWNAGDKGYRGRELDLWYAHKKSGEAEWGKSKIILKGYVGSHRSFIELKSGRLLMTFAKAMPGKDFKSKDPSEIDFGWNEVVSLKSDDNGETWQQSKNSLKIQIDPKKATRYGAIEPVVVQLNGGKLWMLIRTNTGVLYETFSNDDGATWDDPAPSRFISSDSPAHFLRLRDGRLVLVLNMSQRWDVADSYAFGGREVLHAAISDDDGRTWKGFREVLRTHSARKKGVRGDSGSAYPAAIENKDGKIVMVSGQGEDGAVVVFDPNWLTTFDSKLDEKSSESWTLFGYEDVVKKSLNKDGLNIQADNLNDGFEAVWNFPATIKGKILLELQATNKDAEFSLSLTDHFSISSDTAAYQHALSTFSFNDQTNASKTIPIIIKWDLNKAFVEIDLNEKKFKLPIKRNSAFGINYLRLGTKSRTPTKDCGFLIKSVKVTTDI